MHLCTLYNQLYLALMSKLTIYFIKSYPINHTESGTIYSSMIIEIQNICTIHPNGHVINNEEMQEPCKTVAHIILTASLF